MATSPVSVENYGAGDESGKGELIRVIVADTQAIFRAGLRKIFALEDDIRVVGQAETLAQTLSAVKKFSADVLIFEAALAQNPVEAVGDVLRQAGQLRVVVVTPAAEEEMTLELFRRGAHGIVSREVGSWKRTATRARGLPAGALKFSSRQKKPSSSPA
jgi:two-component system, NarL family, nitrate/nitrite response regulator NarL